MRNQSSFSLEFKRREYALDDDMDELKSRGFEIGIARADNPYGNAMMGSFFKTPKYGEVYL